MENDESQNNKQTSGQVPGKKWGVHEGSKRRGLYCPKNNGGRGNKGKNHMMRERKDRVVVKKKIAVPKNSTEGRTWGRIVGQGIKKKPIGRKLENTQRSRILGEERGEGRKRRTRRGGGGGKKKIGEKNVGNLAKVQPTERGATKGRHRIQKIKDGQMRVVGASQKKNSGACGGTGGSRLKTGHERRGRGQRCWGTAWRGEGKTEKNTNEKKSIGNRTNGVPSHRGEKQKKVGGRDGAKRTKRTGVGRHVLIDRGETADHGG